MSPTQIYTSSKYVLSRTRPLSRTKKYEMQPRNAAVSPLREATDRITIDTRERVERLVRLIKVERDQRVTFRFPSRSRCAQKRKRERERERERKGQKCAVSVINRAHQFAANDGRTSSFSSDKRESRRMPRDFNIVDPSGVHLDHCGRKKLDPSLGRVLRTD